MLRHVLVPLDGSTRAEQALPIAAHIARVNDGTLTLLRVVTFPVYVDPFSVQIRADEIMKAGIAEAKSYLAQVLTANILEGVEVKTEVCVGIPAQEILEVAQAQQVDLIVMCSHGTTGLPRWVLGSVAQQVVRQCLIPVFILREGGPLPIAKPDPPDRPVRMLVALDGSPFAEKVLVPAAQLCAALAAPAQGALHLTLVLRRLSGLHDGKKETLEAIYASVMSDARTYLNDMERRLREPDLAAFNLRVMSSIIVKDDVADTLIKAAEHGKYIEDDFEGFDGCDIIALATHGRSGLSRLVLGSVTEHILGATKLPLLIVRPVEQATQTIATEKERVKKTPQEDHSIQVGLA
jgi:nucleotide-binding universal stress UspA family protein